ncbi:MAG: Alkaline phosphatase precursor, partial [Bacteroidota bacterium]
FRTIKETQAEGVFMVSGDVHWAELSRQQPDGMYPLYDMTSSGLNQIEDFPRANQYRVGNATRDLNFGMIDIDWNSTPINITLRVYNKQGQVRIEQAIPLTDLQF